MRTTRALIAGLGTTGSLVAAAACVFLVASAVIAFKGWPAGGLVDSIDNLMVNDAPPVAWDVPGTSAVAASAATAGAVVAAAPAGAPFGVPGVGLGESGAVIRTAPPGERGLPEGTVPGGPGLPNFPANPIDGAPLPPLPGVDAGSVRNTVADTVRGTTGEAGRTVRETTGTLGNTVGGDAGRAIGQTGQGLGDTVDNAGAVADGVLRQP